MVLDSIYIAIVWVYIIDYLDIHPINFKPFNCSTCLTFWCSIICSILVHECYTIYIFALASICSYMTTILYNCMVLLTDKFNGNRYS